MQSIKIGLKNLAKLNQTSLIYKRRNILHQMLPSSQGIFMFSSIISSNFVKFTRMSFSNAEKPENDPRKLTDADWEKRLSPEQYYVCREKGTELPFSGSYYRHKEEGMYSCTCCGIDLFSSKVKFESGCGWPSFYEAHGAVGGNEKNSNILRRPDNSHGMLRTEVLCKKCNAHLGHVFPDGPPPTGLRYCINSVALKFYPKKMT